MGQQQRAALLALVGSLLVYVAALALFPATGDQDAALHALHSLFPLEASRLLSVWSRPLFAVPYVIPAWIGYPAMRLCTAAISALAAWITYLAARRAALPRPWIAIPLVLLQPCLFVPGVDTMTEPIFALVLAAGLWAFVDGRLLLAAGCWSFLPLARPEGPIVLAVAAVVWLPTALHDPRYRRAIALLALGMLVWEAACIVVTHNPRFLIDTFPWQVHSQYAPGPVTHFVTRWPWIIGWGVLPLWLAGLSASWRSPMLRLCIFFTAAVFLVHSALFALGSMSSTGFDRYFGTLAPAAALIALAGLDVLTRWAPRGMQRALVPLLLLEGAQAFATLDGNPLNHAPAATMETVAQARTRTPLGQRHVLSADNFGYVFLHRDVDPAAPAPGARDSSLAAIARLPAGTVVLWDDLTGDWWYHLTVEDFTSRGYRLLWDRKVTLGSPLAELGRRAHVSLWPTRNFRQSLLVRE